MNPREQELLGLLLRLKQPVPIKTLADSLGVSEKSVRNYVNSLNGLNPWIQFGKGGLTASIEAIKAHLPEPEDTDEIPDSPKEREFYLIQQLLLRQENPSAMDVCDALAISDSTLKSDLIRLNRQYQECGIRFRMRKGHLEYTGDAAAVRSVVQSLIREETEDHFLHLDVLKSMFGEEAVNTAYSLWESLLKEWKAADNDLVLANLLYHTMLIVSSSTACEGISFEKKPESLSEALIQQISSQFQIRISAEDKNKLFLLAKQCEGSTRISSEVRDFCQAVQKRLEKDYYADLSDETFLRLLENHAELLLKRIRSNNPTSNPLTKTTKTTSPVVYEMAVSAADEFRQHFDAVLSEDEIAFFALHIGAHLDFVSSLAEVYALCPAYHSLKDQFYARLREGLAGAARVVEISLDSQIEDPEALIISPLPICGRTKTQTVVQISPFVSSADLQKVRKSLELLKARRDVARRERIFDDLFSKERFRICRRAVPMEEVLQTLCSEIVDAGYAEPDLLEQVVKRESFCATAYDGFAIPHPLHPKASKSCVSVALFPKGMDWNGQKVYLVFLLSLKETDSQLFREVYEPLASLLLQPGSADAFSSLPDFASFRQAILEQIA